METIDIIIAISGLLLTVLLALVPYYRRVYFLGPELTIELLPNGGYGGERGLSPKNDTSKGFIDANIAIHKWEVTWMMQVKITNNSMYTAYYPKLEYFANNYKFTTLDKLDVNSPIKENEQIVLDASYTITEECMAKDRTQIVGIPKELGDINILLSYKNPYKNWFYTHYTHLNRENKYTRKRPLILNENYR